MPSRRLCLLIFLLPGLLACPQQEAGEGSRGDEALEVEDVTLPVDTALSIEADVKGPKFVEGIGGVLPSDYPLGLPTHEPSSVEGFGTLPNGRRFVEFDSPTAAAAVAASLEERLRLSGWQSRVVAEGRFEASKEGSQVSIAVSDLYSGSRIRVEYQ
jgi:hypothetical protein